MNQIRLVQGFLQLSLFTLTSALASDLPVNYKPTEKNCWVVAGGRYQVNPYLLYAIAEKESGLNPLAVNARGTGKEDVGLMQISSFWFPHLRQYGISRDDLFQSCTSIHVGAWVLAQSIMFFGNTWEAVGAYNVGTSKADWAYRARARYAADVRRRYLALLERLRSS